MLFSIILAVAFYVLIVFAVGYIMNASDINNSMKNTGLVSADAMAKAFSSNAMAKVLIIGGLCGIVTSWNSFLIGGSRAIYAMGNAKMIPKSFGKLSRKSKMPFLALLLIGALSIVSPFFGKTMLVWIVDAGNFACCLAYCIVSMSFVKIRKKSPELYRPYKVKNYIVVGIIAIIMSGVMALLYVIPGTNCTLVWQEWIIVGIWILLGFSLFIFNKIKK